MEISYFKSGAKAAGALLVGGALVGALVLTLRIGDYNLPYIGSTQTSSAQALEYNPAGAIIRPVAQVNVSQPASGSPLPPKLSPQPLEEKIQEEPTLEPTLFSPTYTPEPKPIDTPEPSTPTPPPLYDVGFSGDSYATNGVNVGLEKELSKFEFDDPIYLNLPFNTGNNKLPGPISAEFDYEGPNGMSELYKLVVVDMGSLDENGSLSLNNIKVQDQIGDLAPGKYSVTTRLITPFTNSNSNDGKSEPIEFEILPEPIPTATPPATSIATAVPLTAIAVPPTAELDLELKVNGSIRIGVTDYRFIVEGSITNTNGVLPVHLTEIQRCYASSNVCETESIDILIEEEGTPEKIVMNLKLDIPEDTVIFRYKGIGANEREVVIEYSLNLKIGVSDDGEPDDGNQGDL